MQGRLIVRPVQDEKKSTFLTDDHAHNNKLFSKCCITNFLLWLFFWVPQDYKTDICKASTDACQRNVCSALYIILMVTYFLFKQFRSEFLVLKSQTICINVF